MYYYKRYNKNLPYYLKSLEDENLFLSNKYLLKILLNNSLFLSEWECEHSFISVARTYLTLNL